MSAKVRAAVQYDSDNTDA